MSYKALNIPFPGYVVTCVINQRYDFDESQLCFATIKSMSHIAKNNEDSGEVFLKDSNNIGFTICYRKEIKYNKPYKIQEFSKEEAKKHIKTKTCKRSLENSQMNKEQREEAISNESLLPTVTAIRCKYCRKMYEKPHALKKHQFYCKKNQRNQHKCFEYCEYLQRSKAFDGDYHKTKFQCMSPNTDYPNGLHSYIAEKKNLDDGMTTRMPLKCPHYQFDPKLMDFNDE